MPAQRKPLASRLILVRSALKKLAAKKHQGNVSALIAEMAEDAVRQAAFEKA